MLNCLRHFYKGCDWCLGKDRLLAAPHLCGDVDCSSHTQLHLAVAKIIHASRLRDFFQNRVWKRAHARAAASSITFACAGGGGTIERSRAGHNSSASRFSSQYSYRSYWALMPVRACASTA